MRPIEARRVIVALLLAGASLAPGCAVRFEAIDLGLAQEARRALRKDRVPPATGEEEEPDRIERPSRTRPPQKSLVIGVLLSIFPGVLWHGLGHQYAGDAETAGSIREAGGWGYLLGAIGGGLVVAGAALDRRDDFWEQYALPLYITGGATGGIGAGFFLTAWIYDMVDTPRAVRSGGKPPPQDSLFYKDLKDLGE